MQAAANVLIKSEGDINKGDFSALIVHRLDPLNGVFEQVVQQLYCDAVADGRV